MAAAGSGAAPRIVCLFDDLLVGSKVVGALGAGGLEAELCAPAGVRERLAAGGCEALVVGLAGADFDGTALVEALQAEGALDGVAALGVYAHVDAETRRRAERGGFDRVVPRSRLMREGAALVRRVVDDNREGTR